MDPGEFQENQQAHGGRSGPRKAQEVMFQRRRDPQLQPQKPLELVRGRSRRGCQSLWAAYQETAAGWNPTGWGSKWSKLIRRFDVSRLQTIDRSRSNVNPESVSFTRIRPTDFKTLQLQCLLLSFLILYINQNGNSIVLWGGADVLVLVGWWQKDQTNLIYRLGPAEGRWPWLGHGVFGNSGRGWRTFCDFLSFNCPMLHHVAETLSTRTETIEHIEAVIENHPDCIENIWNNYSSILSTSTIYH